MISQHKTLKKYREDRTASLVGGKGLKALSRESRERLEAYQHLFYLLQTQPSYLAKLVFEIPQVQHLQDVIQINKKMKL